MLEKMEKWGYGSCAELHQWGRGCDLKIFTPGYFIVGLFVLYL
jgi:hypothetical protein